jgi:hypothetical protein
MLGLFLEWLRNWQLLKKGSAVSEFTVVTWPIHEHTALDHRKSDMAGVEIG